MAGWPSTAKAGWRRYRQSVHRSNAVKQFAAATDGRLRLCFLPGHAPELNPDEWVWKHVKRDRIGRAGVSGPDDL